MDSPGEAHMPYMALFLLSGLVVLGPSVPCLSVISSLRPSFEKNYRVFELRMY